jgi:TonB-dependent starch-binding outer membrane protein SusC
MPVVREPQQNQKLMKKLYKSLWCFSLCFLIHTASWSQDQLVKGKVTDGTGQGMPGVNVFLKGTTSGTATDGNGSFAIQAQSSDVLVISFIGYKTQEIAVGSQSTINVKLDEDFTTLQEIVITGYGELRRADLTSAQISINSENLQKSINTTLEQAIQGRAAGVYITQNTGAPGGGISVNIRGVNSIMGANEPLYVIDGVQIQGSSSTTGSNPLSSLNPNDIENIEILQGPSATAIYGSRGTNGVVLITTKRGKKGEVRMAYDYMYSLQTEPKQLKVMDLQQYAQMDNEYKSIAGGNVREEFLDPSLLGAGTNWQSELFKSAAMQKHQLSMSGGGEATTFYLSGERMNQDGVAIGSGFDRSSLRLNLDNKPRTWLSIGVNMNASQTNTTLATMGSDIIARAIQMGPYIPVKNLDGSYGGGNITNNSAEQFLPPNPIGLSRITTNELTQRRFLGGMNVGVKIIEGLEVRTYFNTDVNFSNSTYFLPTYVFGYQRNDQAILNNNHNFGTYWQWNQLIQYNKQFGKHHLNAMVSHEAQESTWKNLFAERRGFPTNDVKDINVGDQSLDDNAGGHGSWAQESYLGRLNYSFGDRYIVTAAVRADGSINFGPGNKWGSFPSLSAAWRVSEESFFELPAVNDLRLRYETGLTGNQGSSYNIYGTLGAGPTEWGTAFIPNKYPNPDLKWEETKTNNFGLTLALFDSKIQIDADYYIKDTENLIIPSTLPGYMGTVGSGSVAPPVVNVGSLQNRGWSFTINTTNIDNGGLKWQSSLNLGQFKTELKTLTTGTAQLDRVNWWMKDWTQRSVVGQAPWLFYGYIQDGVFESVEELQNSALPADNNGVEFPIAENSIWVGDVKYRDINADGIISGADQTFIGNPWPKLYGGLTNTLSYKGFDLSVLVTGTYGNDVYNYIRNENSNPNNINLGRNMFLWAFDYARVAEDDNNSPYLENPGTSVARMSGGNRNNNFDRHVSRFVEDGSYLRVKNLSLNYNLSNSLLAKLRHIKAARVGLSAQNLFTFTNYSGYDPEVGSYVGSNASAANQAIGVDNGRYPLTPVYAVNVRIEF